MSQISLLQRLGQSKEQVRNQVLRQDRYRQPQPVEDNTLSQKATDLSESPQVTAPNRDGQAEGSAPLQAASSFAGRRSSTAQQDALQELRITVHQKLVDEMTPEEQQIIAQGESAREQIRNLISTYCDKELETSAQPLSRIERQKLVELIFDELLGLGPLEALLKDEDITEIMVNGPQDIFIEKHGRIELSDVHFYNEDHLMNIIERILAPLGRHVDESSPLVDARLKNGSRVNIIIPPLALDGAAITIRKFSSDAMSIDDLVRLGTLDNKMGLFLEACVKARLNILVSGGTGSGKTTTLNVLSSFIPSNERIVTIEDAAELKLRQRHVVRLEVRPANVEGTGEVTVRDLVRNALRMRPDRIIVGEVRSGEALDMLQAMNTGHDGSLTTAHANSPRDVLSRLETMVLMAGMDLPLRAIRTQTASAIDIILQQSRLPDGSRKVTHITEVQGIEGDIITLQDIFRYVQDDIDQHGKVVGHFEPTGLQPKCSDKFFAHGLKLSPSLFSDERSGER